ncbi:Hypothetical predicted protein [Octopus vulgaris]|uniref:Uncharacterized protein n=1 Tax=Octopus vulgaris TaxID=6645 RepID=A0AA36BZZ8_OCTVU|nr:Hypothetical predicted protein [Octopus vulgaris]
MGNSLIITAHSSALTQIHRINQRPRLLVNYQMILSNLYRIDGLVTDFETILRKSLNRKFPRPGLITGYWLNNLNFYR